MKERKQTRRPIHPGNILKHHHFIPLVREGCIKNIYDFSKKLTIDVDTIRLLFREKIDVSEKIAIKLAFALNTSVNLWKNLQMNFDKFVNTKRPQTKYYIGSVEIVYYLDHDIYNKLTDFQLACIVNACWRFANINNRGIIKSIDVDKKHRQFVIYYVSTLQRDIVTFVEISDEIEDISGIGLCDD